MLLICFLSFNSFRNEILSQIENQIGSDALSWKNSFNSSINQINSSSIREEQLIKNHIASISENANQLLRLYSENSNSKNTAFTLISNTKVGTSGYIYVLDASDNYIVSKNRNRDGENIWNEKIHQAGFLFRRLLMKEKN